MAETNQTYGLDTVVFFDEANTTEAIGLIKEIMCDRRMNGRTVSNALKFIAACNPYRRYCLANSPYLFVIIIITGILMK